MITKFQKKGPPQGAESGRGTRGVEIYGQRATGSIWNGRDGCEPFTKKIGAAEEEVEVPIPAVNTQ